MFDFLFQVGYSFRLSLFSFPNHLALQKSYWFPDKRRRRASAYDIMMEENSGAGAGKNAAYFEPEPEGIQPGVVVKSLRKVFKSIRGERKKKMSCQ